MTAPKLYTSTEAARILGVSTSRVWALARARGLKRIGRDWLFTADDLERIRPGPNGRPPKKPKK